MQHKCVDNFLRYWVGRVWKMLCCFFLFFFYISGLFSNEILHSSLYLFILFLMWCFLSLLKQLLFFFFFCPCVFHYWWNPASDEDDGFVSSKQVKKIYWRLSPGSCFVKTSRVNSWLWLFIILCNLKKKKIRLHPKTSTSANWDSRDQPQSFFSNVVPVYVTCDFSWWLLVVKCLSTFLKVKTAFFFFFKAPRLNKILMWSLFWEADSCEWTSKWGQELWVQLKV